MYRYSVDVGRPVMCRTTGMRQYWTAAGICDAGVMKLTAEMDADCPGGWDFRCGGNGPPKVVQRMVFMARRKVVKKAPENPIKFFLDRLDDGRDVAVEATPGGSIQIQIPPASA